MTGVCHAISVGGTAEDKVQVTGVEVLHWEVGECRASVIKTIENFKCD